MSNPCLLSCSRPINPSTSIYPRHRRHVQIHTAARYDCFGMKPKLLRWITCIALFTGCAGGSPPAKTPATKPVDHVQLSDEATTNLTDKLEPPEANQTIYFGELDGYDSDNPDTPTSAMPLIAVHDEQWKAIPVTGHALTNAGWKYVAAGPSRHEIWGVLDTSAGDSRSEFVLAHSTDGGGSFTLKVIEKPCRLATFADFAMSRDGHGRVTLSLDTDCGQHKSGLYHYDTTNDFKTWPDQPRYEPDAMLQAASVPDDEQPDAASPPSHPVVNHATQKRRIRPALVSLHVSISR